MFAECRVMREQWPGGIHWPLRPQVDPRCVSEWWRVDHVLRNLERRASTSACDFFFYSGFRKTLNDFCQFFPPSSHHHRSPKSLQTPMRHWRSPHSVWPRAAHPAQWDVSRQRMSPHKRQLWFRQTLGGSDIKAKVKSSFSSSALRFTYNTTGTKSCSYLRLRGKKGRGGGDGDYQLHGGGGRRWLPGPDSRGKKEEEHCLQISTRLLRGVLKRSPSLAHLQKKRI